MNQKEWTIMIYMAGDNNLAVDMAYAMEQIKGVAEYGAESPNLFVYYDGNSPSIPTLYCDFSEPGKPRYVRSYKVPDKLCDVPEKENENAADRRSILNFINWCMKVLINLAATANSRFSTQARHRSFLRTFARCWVCSRCHSSYFSAPRLFSAQRSTSGKLFTK